MKKGKRGFTLVEVAIFLAITGVLFIGITAGVQNSVYQQRRNDAVQSFVEFLRGVYAKVENVQNDVPGGRSEKAIYGKLVTFGEAKDFTGGSTGGKKIFVYTVVGDIRSSEESGTLGVLADLGANVRDGTGNLAGYPEEFNPKWGSVIEKATGELQNAEPIRAALLVVRHPSSGTIYTYYKSNGTIEVNQGIREGVANPLAGLNDLGFDLAEVNFCVNPMGEDMAKDRTHIRIVKGARNASGIEQIPDHEASCGVSI